MGGCKIRFFAVIILGYILTLYGTEGTEAVMTEEGWFHSKQIGRYGEANQSEIAGHLWLNGMRPFAVLRGMWIEGRSMKKKATATAVGGRFGLETGQWNGISLQASAQTSQKVPWLNPETSASLHPELFGEGGRAFTYVSEAELRYGAGGFSLQAGRIRLQTPYADPDDIRMAYNTFEGALATYTLDDAWNVTLLYVGRWAGVDSGAAQSEFVRLAEHSEGMGAAGVVYTTEEETQMSLWYYHVDRQYDLLYAEAVGRTPLVPLMHLEWGLQASGIRERDGSGIEGKVFGGMGMLHYRNYYGGAAYNHAEISKNHVVTDGFGGGPYFTSLDEATLTAVSECAPGHHLSVYRIGGGIDLGWEREEEAHLEAVYGLFDPEGSPIEFQEADLLFGMDVTSSLRFEAVATAFRVRGCYSSACSDFERYWIRVEYAF